MLGFMRSVLGAKDAPRPPAPNPFAEPIKQAQSATPAPAPQLIQQFAPLSIVPRPQPAPAATAGTQVGVFQEAPQPVVVAGNQVGVFPQAGPVIQAPGIPLQQPQTLVQAVQATVAQSPLPQQQGFVQSPPTIVGGPIVGPTKFPGGLPVFQATPQPIVGPTKFPGGLPVFQGTPAPAPITPTPPPVVTTNPVTTPSPIFVPAQPVVPVSPGPAFTPAIANESPGPTGGRASDAMPFPRSSEALTQGGGPGDFPAGVTSFPTYQPSQGSSGQRYNVLPYGGNNGAPAGGGGGGGGEEPQVCKPPWVLIGAIFGVAFLLRVT